MKSAREWSCPQFDEQMNVIVRPANAMRMTIEAAHHSAQIAMKTSIAIPWRCTARAPLSRK